MENLYKSARTRGERDHPSSGHRARQVYQKVLISIRNPLHIDRNRCQALPPQSGSSKLQVAAGKRLGLGGRSSFGPCRVERGYRRGYYDARAHQRLCWQSRTNAAKLGNTVPQLLTHLSFADMKTANFLHVSDGQAGELIIRGPTVMKSYHNNAAATKDAFHEAWFQTGGNTIRINGKFFIIDCKKELLGLQVSPSEIEHFLTPILRFRSRHLLEYLRLKVSVQICRELKWSQTSRGYLRRT